MAKPPTPTETDKMIYRIEYTAYSKQTRTIQQAVEALYSLLWGQCTDAMRQQLKAMPTHGNTATRLDGIQLLKEVKSLAYNYQSQKFVGSSFMEGFKALTNCMQDKLTVQKYQKTFQNTVDVFESTAGTCAVTNHLGMQEYVMSTEPKYAGKIYDSLSETEQVGLGTTASRNTSDNQR
jgi:hypothetical protein